MVKAGAMLSFAASAEDGEEGVPRMGGWLRWGSAASLGRLDVLQDAAASRFRHGADDPCRRCVPGTRKRSDLTRSPRPDSPECGKCCELLMLRKRVLDSTGGNARLCRPTYPESC